MIEPVILDVEMRFVSTMKNLSAPGDQETHNGQNRTTHVSLPSMSKVKGLKAEPNVKSVKQPNIITDETPSRCFNKKVSMRNDHAGESDSYEGRHSKRARLSGQNNVTHTPRPAVALPIPSHSRRDDPQEVITIPASTHKLTQSHSRPGIKVTADHNEAPIPKGSIPTHKLEAIKQRLLAARYTPIVLPPEMVAHLHQHAATAPSVVFTLIIWPQKPHQNDNDEIKSPLTYQERECQISQLQHRDQARIYTVCHDIATTSGDIFAMLQYRQIHLESLQYALCAMEGKKSHLKQLARHAKKMWHRRIAVASAAKKCILPDSKKQERWYERSKLVALSDLASETHQARLEMSNVRTLIQILEEWQHFWTKRGQSSTDIINPSPSLEAIRALAPQKRTLRWIPKDQETNARKRGWTGLREHELPDTTCAFVKIDQVKRRTTRRCSQAQGSSKDACVCVLAQRLFD